MSDVPEGAGWWQASDGKWYAPERFGSMSMPTPTPTPAPAPAPAPPTMPPPPAGLAPTPPAGLPVAGSFGDPVLCAVGDIAVTATEVTTPIGRQPLQGTTWIVANNTFTTQGIPVWAIIMCVLTVWLCLLGLLFLLAKEDRTTGQMQVSVQRAGFFHATAIPVSNPAQMADVENRVNYIRSLVASLG